MTSTIQHEATMTVWVVVVHYDTYTEAKAFTSAFAARDYARTKLALGGEAMHRVVTTTTEVIL